MTYFSVTLTMDAEGNRYPELYAAESGVAGQTGHKGYFVMTAEQAVQLAKDLLYASVQAQVLSVIGDKPRPSEAKG